MKTPGGVLKYIAPAGLLVIAAVSLAIRSQGWVACFGEATPPLGVTYSAACRDEMSLAVGDLLPLWCLGILAFALVLLVKGWSWSWGLLSVVFLLAANPILDPGFIWQGWDTADAVPGLGILSSAATVATALLMLGWVAWGKPQSADESTPAPPLATVG